MQTVIVLIIVTLSGFYLGQMFLKSLQQKKSGHCSGCGKD